jgi:hypothetical protein
MLIGERDHRAETMRHLGIVLAGWLLAGIGAALGSLLGRIFGPQGLYIGAIAGAVGGIAAATDLLRWRGWLTPPHDHRARFLGLIGLAFAAPLASMGLNTPVILILATGLVGLGMLLGAHWPAKQRS